MFSRDFTTLPLDNEGRDDKDRITYDSLWVHAKRHYDLAATTAYWRARMHKELMNALRG